MTHTHRFARWSVAACIVLLAISGLSTIPSAAATTSQDDCNTGSDAQFPGPYLEAPVLRCNGELPSSDDDNDWYRVNATTGQTLTLIAQNPIAAPEGLFFCLYAPGYDFDSDTGYVTCGDQRNTNGTRSAIQQPVNQTGAWTIRLDIKDYNLSVTRHEQIERGRILATHGTLDETGTLGANRVIGPSPADGIDGDWVELDATATGHERLRLTNENLHIAGINVPAELQQRFRADFYTDDIERIPGDHCEHAIERPLVCFPPDGAKWVYVTAYENVGMDYQLEYLY